MKRREFIELSTQAGIISLIQAHSSFTGLLSSPSLNSTRCRITDLRLQTVADLDKMKNFYGDTTGLPVLSYSNSELIVRAGETTISFIKTSLKDMRPFYHFAFNIPENKIKDAFEWQRKKTPVIHPNPAGAVDEIVNFAHWNAHSIFFLDPAGNLLEYIARHDLENAAKGKFSVDDILYASEIGFIVDDVIASGNALKKSLSISEYRSATPGFWPIGDETGLLLMIQKGKVWSGHPGQINQTSIFKTSVTVRSSIANKWDFPGYPYELLPAANG